MIVDNRAASEREPDQDLQLQNERRGELVATVLRLSEDNRRHHYAIGEALVELLTFPDEGGGLPELKGLREEHFAELTLGFLSQCKRMAEATTEEDRAFIAQQGLSARETYDAIVQSDRIGREARQRGIVDPPTLCDIVQELGERKADARVSARSVGKGWMSKQIEATREQRMAELAETEAERPDWQRRMHNIDCRELLRSGEIEDGSVQVAWFDPPYLYWQDGADPDDPLSGGGRGYNHNFGSALCAKADNHQRKDALPLIRETIELVLPKLKKGGFLVYWAAGGELDEPEVVHLIRRHFGYVFTYFWRKPPTVGYQYKQSSVETERAIVCSVDPKAVQDYDPSVLAKQIIEGYPTPKRTEKSAALGETSIYEKPVKLCQAFLSKLTLPGDLVLDLCGCRATMTEACVIDQRDYFYTETAENNYAFGVGRIRERMTALDQDAEQHQEQACAAGS